MTHGAPPGRAAQALSRAIVAALMAAAVTLAIWLFPFDGDAAFVTHDALWYGMNAERSPAASIYPSHPLFHVIVLALLGPLRALDVPEPGHVACRIVAGLGGAWLLLQVCALAGSRRLLVGSAFALVLLASRGFVIETGTGENVVPATAAGLFALTCAAGARHRLATTVAALTLALLFRQDNLMLLPGIVLGFARSAPAGARTAALVKLLTWAGALTLVAYAAAWLVATKGQTGFLAWMLGTGGPGPRPGDGALDADRLGTHVGAVAFAMTGRIGPASGAHPAIGAAYLVAIGVPGLMLLGSAPRLRLVGPIALAAATWFAFHAWFEAGNFEWLVLPIAACAAGASGLACGEPATPRWMRGAAVLLLLGLAGWLAVAHGPTTWMLRERTVVTSVREATTSARGDWRFLAASVRAHQAMALLRVPHDRIDEGPGVLDRLREELEKRPAPTAILWDRGLLDGMPHALRHVRRAVTEIDTRVLPDDWKKITRDGLVHGLAWTPPGHPSTRR